MIETTSNNARVFSTNAHTEHTGGDIVAVAVAESKSASSFIYTTVTTEITFLRVVRIENHGMEADVEIIRQIVIRSIGQLFSNIVAIARSSGNLPKMVTKHIDKVGVFRINDEVMVVKSITFINVMANSGGHSRKGCIPSLALVSGNIDASVNARIIDKAGIDNVGIRRSDGEINHTIRSAKGKEVVTFQIAGGARVVHHVLDIATNIDRTVNSGDNGIIRSNFHTNGNTFNSSGPIATTIA